MRKTRIYISFLMALAVAPALYAQSQEKVLSDSSYFIIKPFEPTLVKANKISEDPVIEDTQKVELDFNYTFIEKQMPSEFSVDTIEAAKIKGEPLVKLYRGYAKLGIGTNTTPLAEVFFNSLRSRNTSLGVHLKHFSSNGINSIKNSDFSDNSIDLYGKKFTKKHTIGAGIDYTINKFNYYGDYDGYLGADDDADVRKDQAYNKLGVNFSFGNTTTDSADGKFSVGIGFRHIQDKYDAKESNVKFESMLQKRIDHKLIGRVEFDVDHNDYESKPLDSTTNEASTTIMRIYPHLVAGNDIWKASLGPSFFIQAGDDSEFKFYLVGEIKVNLIKEILIPYAGVRGALQRNNYLGFTADNKFVASDLTLKNTSSGPLLYGGLRGSFSSRISFNTSISHGDIKDEPFYVKNYFAVNGNDRSFVVTYADLSLTEITGEIAYQQKEKIKVFLVGQYFDYNMNNSTEQAVHKPKFKVTLTGQYDLRDKIIAKVDIFAIGRQKALVILGSDDPAVPFTTGYKTLDGILDMNLGLEYRYTKKVSAFINFNNIGSVKYQRWQDYPTQQFNVLGGLKFSF